ncbi:hypothetical protein HDU92_007638 [Lobulomyces angularis]|nr:hypothetical protein HDU92_007638 [Lobulomyces angularis]
MTVDNTQILNLVKHSTRKLAESDQDLHVNLQNIEEFVRNHEKFDFLNLATSNPPTILPLKFESIEQEVNIIALMDLLQIGSGWRRELHTYCDRGAADTIKFGIMSMHISGETLSSKFLQAITVNHVADFFGLPLFIDKPHESHSAITISVSHPLKPLINTIKKILNETGEKLLELRFDSFGAFCIESAKKSNQNAERFIQDLFNTFPAFRDVDVWNDNEIYILKKAQLVASDLFKRFHKENETFAFKDINKLTIFADNVIPVMLIELKMIEVKDERILNWISLKQDDIELIRLSKVYKYDLRLRAISVYVGTKIIEKFFEFGIKIESEKDCRDVYAIDVDTFLWKLGKVGENRKLDRFSVKETDFF